MPAWLTWTLVALASWGVWAFLSRLLGDALSGGQSQALSTLGLLPMLAPLGLRSRASWRTTSRKGLWLALAGGAVSCLGNVPYYAAVARGERFAALVSLTALAPAVTVLLAVLCLRERLSRVQLAGVVLAIGAIWLFNVSKEASLVSPLVLVALPPIVLWGLAGFLQKVATNYVAAEPAALVFLAAFVPLGIFYAAREPWPATISLRTWAVVLALGFFLAFGNYAVLAAYARSGKAAVIAPLVNLYPLVSIGCALLMGESVGRRELAGIGCALAAVTALAWEPSSANTAATPPRA
jgi:drug/metabolite transporter (DMT)-like permease